MNRLDLDSRQQASIAQRSNGLVSALIKRAWEYGLVVQTLPCGATLIDAGVDVLGSFEAGLRLIEICHGGLANASLGLADIGGFLLPQVTVESFHPTISTYGLQASYPLSADEPGIRVSGPIRLYLDGTIATENPAAIAVIESDRLIGDEVALALAERSNLPPRSLTLIVVPGWSVAGAVQIAGRVNESVIFTLEESLKVDSRKVVQMIGQAPVCPVGRIDSPEEKRPYPDDFIHYAGEVFFTLLASPADDLERLARLLSFASTSIYGSLFHDTLAAAGGVFEAIPDLIHINKPAQVTIEDLSTGRAARAGVKDVALLTALLGGAR
jgi:methenyltetrahydromethanopterin cyclohydrolase